MPVLAQPARLAPAVTSPRPRRSRRSLAAASASAALLVGVVGTTAAFAADRKTVQLTVDGTTAPVELRGDTVAEVLAAAGVTAGEHDLLSPSADSTVREGDRVALRHARPLELVVDGQSRTVWVTADDVDEALDEAGVSDDAFVSASRSRQLGPDGMSIDVRLPKQVAVAVDGATTPRTSTAATVAEVLAEAAVVLTPDDQVVPSLATAVTDGLQIAVTRITTREVGVPFGTEQRADAGLFKDETRELQAGVVGVDRQVWAATTVGAVQTPALLGAVPLTAPRPRIVAVGTKPRPVVRPAPAPAPARAVAAPVPAQAGGGLNWAALARCESGGNPASVSSSGTYHGLYQFSVSTWRGVGGAGLPSQASASEQTARAQALYARSGASSWPVCGRYL